jgi:hypothetical protein
MPLPKVRRPKHHHLVSGPLPARCPAAVDGREGLGMVLRTISFAHEPGYASCKIAWIMHTVPRRCEYVRASVAMAQVSAASVPVDD